MAVSGVRAQIRATNKQNSLEFELSLKRELYLNFMDALLAYRSEFMYLKSLYFEKADRNIADELLLLEQSLYKLSFVANSDLLKRTEAILEHTRTEDFKNFLFDYGYIESRRCFANTKLDEAFSNVCENSYSCYKSIADEVSEKLKSLSSDPKRLEMLNGFERSCDEIIELMKQELRKQKE